MIRVTIELFPHGDETRKRTLGSADIWNDGSGDISTGNYGYRIRGKDGRVFRVGTVTGFRRLSASAWQLLALALRDAFKRPEQYLRSTAPYKPGVGVPPVSGE